MGGLLLLLAVCGPLRGQGSMANSSRECAICHVRWISAFEKADTQPPAGQGFHERRAGTSDMCLSCHDGSVVDSRFLVWSTQNHTTGTLPPESVQIPTDIFPLDEAGHMTCATCHTAHAVAGSSDIRTTIFLRKPNVDSSL